MNTEKSKAVLLLGSNSGNRVEYINKALSQIEKQAGKITLESSVYQTAPWGFTEQPDFLNKVVVIETSLQPLKLLQLLKSIEKKLGRVRAEKWKQRIIDIDILFYDEIIVESDKLKIPHPMIKERMFTLVPLNEIMPGFIHPVLKRTIKEMVCECMDNGKVERLNMDFLRNESFEQMHN